MKISTLIFTSIRESFKTVILESLKIVEDEKNNILEVILSTNKTSLTVRDTDSIELRS